MNKTREKKFIKNWSNIYNLNTYFYLMKKIIRNLQLKKEKKRIKTNREK